MLINDNKRVCKGLYYYENTLNTHIMQDDTIHILINKSEKVELQRKAKKRGISMSRYIRSKLITNLDNI